MKAILVCVFFSRGVLASVAAFAPLSVLAIELSKGQALFAEAPAPIELSKAQAVHSKGQVLPAEAPTPKSPDNTARLYLLKVLKTYKGPVQIAINQELFLSSLKTAIKSSGVLNIQNGKFHLSLKASPSSLMVFDGRFLWYQADTKENAVFKLPKDHPAGILTGLLSWDRFFEFFQIRQSQKSGNEYIIHLQATHRIEGLSGIFMKAGSYISEIRLVWEDLDNWQKYHLSAPVAKRFGSQTFRFNDKGFRVITDI